MDNSSTHLNGRSGGDGGGAGDLLAGLGGVEGAELGRLIGAREPLVGGVRGHAAEGGRVEVLLERLGLARHDELEHLHGVPRQLERHRRLALHDVARALREEGHPLTGYRRAVLRQRKGVGRLVHALVVPDVPVALTRCEPAQSRAPKGTG